MPKIEFTIDTIAKQEPKPAKELPDDQKVQIAAGTEWDLSAFNPQPINGHYRFSLKSPHAIGNPPRNTWLAFGQHIRVTDDNEKQIFPVVSKEIRLDVPFFAQMAIASEPTIKSLRDQERTCFTSSMAMCLKYLGANIKGDDDYFAIVRKYGDTTLWPTQIASAKHLGFECYQRQDADFADLRKSLESGKPAVIGILHRGTEDRPTGGGHLIAVIGIKEDDSLIVHDPYGDLKDGYTGKVEKGNGAIYSRRSMARRWTVEGPGHGWAMFFE